MERAIGSLSFSRKDDPVTIAGTVQVDGMACPVCAYNIEKRMKTLEGVDPKAEFTVSVERGLAELAWREQVEFDRNVVREQLRRAGFTPGAISITATGQVESTMGRH